MSCRKSSSRLLLVDVDAGDVSTRAHSNALKGGRGSRLAAQWPSAVLRSARGSLWRARKGKRQRKLEAEPVISLSVCLSGVQLTGHPSGKEFELAVHQFFSPTDLQQQQQQQRQLQEVKVWRADKLLAKFKTG